MASRTDYNPICLAGGIQICFDWTKQYRRPRAKKARAKLSTMEILWT
jgi:hypothetical protein